MGRFTSTVGNVNASTAQTSATTELFDTAIRKLEQQDAKKLREKRLSASTGISTEPIRESYVGICHPDLRQDLEKFQDMYLLKNTATPVTSWKVRSAPLRV